MLKNITLDRPLAVLDLETTGIDPKLDRIVEVSVLKLLPGGDHDHRTRRVNPGVPIPPEATAVHGITDDDVADCPTFRAIAPALSKYLDGCDLAGLQHPGLRPAAPGRRVQPGRVRVPGCGPQGDRCLPDISPAGTP